MQLLRDIAARPRPTGGEAIENARQRCKDELLRAGYTVAERPFEYSQFPGRLATPLFGATAATLVGAAGVTASQGLRFAALPILVVGAVALVIVGRWLARRGVLTLPLLRASGVNLEAARLDSAPTIWLVAHLDSKSQPVPTLVRTAGVILTAFGYLLTAVLATLLVAGATPLPFFWLAAAVLTLAGAIPVVLSMVGDASPGAMDNASGVATVLMAAVSDALPRNVGILITDAEELGLAGARAWAGGQVGGWTGGRVATPSIAILNCDGVDDRGDIVAMYSGRRPNRIAAAIARSSANLGTRCSVGRLLPGVLTDAIAFSDLGVPAVTFSRGTFGSLARIHTRRDDLDHLTGTGIAQTAALIAATAVALEEER